MEIKYIDRRTGETKTENPPAEGFLKFLYDTSIGSNLFLPLVKQKILSEVYGQLMDRPASVRQIPKFVAEYGIDLSEAQKDLDEFTSFNDFFYRKLKPGARQIGDNFVSPGDGRLLAFAHADEVNSFYVKGRRFTLREFLGSQALATAYRGASMVILRLAPNDYHRYHFPYDGVPAASEPIGGPLFSVSPYALLNNFTQVFCENQRELCRFALPNNEEVLLIPVGATMVGSINATYVPDAPVQKGDEMGYYAFGGSTVVLLFQADKFQISPDLIENTQAGLETYVKMGEEIAKVR